MSDSDSSGGSARPNHWPELDGVRALAVIAVSLFHDFYAVNPSWNPLRPSGGYLGVDVFFVLSGFLITTLLLAEKQNQGGISLTAFYKRRALRLFPALAVLLIVVGAGAAIWTGQVWSHPTLAAMPWVVLYVGNWNGAIYGGSLPIGALGHTWSLAVEEQFYLLWPLILILFVSRIRARRWVGLALFGLGVTEMIYRYLALKHFGWGTQRVYYGTDTSSDGLLFGCGLAFMFSARSWKAFSRRAASALDVATVMAILALGYLVMRESYFNAHGLWFAIPGTVFCTTIVLANMVTRPLPVVGPFLRSRPLVWVGRRSYGIYLWVTAIFLVSGLGTHGLGRYPYGAVVLIAAVVIAAASYRFVEQPFLRRKRRFQRARSPSVRV